ncbi:hypothetical protein F5X97DRAFT_267749 [Nemania serpens]|nr:hypothetical protein F5X97DRAFT_267749 [Nemania serpens]
MGVVIGELGGVSLLLIIVAKVSVEPTHYLRSVYNKRQSKGQFVGRGRAGGRAGGKQWVAVVCVCVCTCVCVCVGILCNVCTVVRGRFLCRRRGV